MYVELDPKIKEILCCPLCKAKLKEKEKNYSCDTCVTDYSLKSIQGKKSEEKILDFRIKVPNCPPKNAEQWRQIQKDYEKRYQKEREKDVLDDYLSQIGYFEEIYNKEFNLTGRVLDVGGGEGRLRHYLKKEVSLYVSIDPFIDIFNDLSRQSNFLKVYPIISQPLNFLAAYAENLPLSTNTFDWVNMKSVLDHFQEPFLALKEACRILKPNGRLLIGNVVYGDKFSYGDKQHKFFFRLLISWTRWQLKKEGIGGLIKSAINKLFNFRQSRITHHTFCWRYEELIDLVKKAKFEIVKEYWQNLPFNKCLYLEVKK